MASSSRNKLIRKKGNVDIDRVLKEIRGLNVSVGIHRGDVDPESGLTVATIGTVNEYGSEDGHTPERSFMRSTFREQIKKYRGNMQKIVQAVLVGKYTAREGMGRLGRLAEQDIKAKITSGVEPANAASTVKAKGGSTGTLRDDGQLLASIRWEFSDESKR